MAGRRLDETRNQVLNLTPAMGETELVSIQVPDDGVDAWLVAFGSSAAPAGTGVAMSILVNGHPQERYRDKVPELGLVPIPYPVRIKLHPMDVVSVVATNSDLVQNYDVNARIIVEL